jgi:polyphosphate kinase 2 (PPK2 family)
VVVLSCTGQEKIDWHALKRWTLWFYLSIHTTPSRTGRTKWKQWWDNKKFGQIHTEVTKMAKWVTKLQKKGKAPKRVILYLEGLDCAGKSSTGGLICQALEQCGYDVMNAQHNRPPSPEQRAKPWMDRGRFEYPDDMYANKDECPEYAWYGIGVRPETSFMEIWISCQYPRN